MPTPDPYQPWADVTPSGNPGDDYQHIQSSPNDFGAAIGSGLEKAGSQIEGALNARQGLLNEVHSSELNTWQADRTTDLFSNFSKLEGKAAQDALPGFKQSIEQVYKDAMGQAGGLESQAMVAKSGRMITDSYYRYATNHADQQFTTWQTKTSVDRAGTYANMAGLAANQGDYEHMNAYLGVSDDEIRKIYEAKGYDPDSISQQVTKNRGGNLKFIIESRADAGGPNGTPDPQGAAALYSQYKAQMDPGSRLSVEEKLKPALMQSAADLGAYAAVGRAPPNQHFATAESAASVAPGYVSRAAGLNIAQNSGPVPANATVAGDSLGRGVMDQYHLHGSAVRDLQPHQVISILRGQSVTNARGESTPGLTKEDLAGPMILSTGVSNNPDEAGQVATQLAIIKAARGPNADMSNVVVMGVGDRSDYQQVGANATIAKAAADAGAKFQPVPPGALKSDRVHPKNYDFFGKGGPAGPQPRDDRAPSVASVAPQPDLPEKSVAYQRVIEATKDNPELQKAELAKVDEMYRVDAIANASKTAPDRAAKYANLAGLAANDGDYVKMEQSLDQSDAEIRKGLEAQHIDKDAIDDLVTRNRGGALKHIIESHLDAGGAHGEPDVEGASALYAKYKTQMDPASRLAIEEKLKPERLRATVESGAQGAVGRGGADDLNSYPGRAIQVESGGDPNAPSPGGGYRGLGQWSPQLERRYGINDSNRSSPVAQANALLQEAAENRDPLMRVLGREPRGFEYYLAHQQGLGGAMAHLGNPDKPAWQNMASTEEGLRRGEQWAKLAIWGNMTPQMKAQFPGGVDTVTSKDFVAGWAQRWSGAAASGALPDKGIAYSRVMASTAGNPELQRMMLGRVNEIYNTENTMNATERAGLEQTVPNLIRATEMGVENVSIPSERIDAIMPPAKAAEWKDEYSIAQQVGAAVRAMRWASPEEVASMQSDVESGQGVLSEAMKTHGRGGGGTTGPGVAGGNPEEETTNQAMRFRVREGMANQFERVVVQRDAMLRGEHADPAQYVADNPAVKKAWQSVQEDPRNPAAWQAYGIATKAVQEQLGTPVEKRGALTTGQAQAFASAWNNPDQNGGASAVLASINEQARLWGDQWPDVYRQIAPKAGAAIRVIAAGVTPQAGRELLESQGVKFDELVKGDADNTIKKDITNAVASQLKDFAGSLSGSQRAQTLADYQQIGERLTALRLDKNGDDAVAAAKTAVNDVLNFKYDFTNGFRIPKSAGVAADAVRMGQIRAMQLLGDENVLNSAPIGSTQLGPLTVAAKQDGQGRGLSPAYLKRETIQGLRDSGSWVTDPKEHGLVLIQGDGFAARRPDGTPVSLTWKQLETLGLQAKKHVKAEPAPNLVNP